MARVGLGLKVEELAAAAGVSYPTLNRLEKGDAVAAASRAKVMRVLLEAGAEFSYRSKRLGVAVPDGAPS